MKITDFFMKKAETVVPTESTELGKLEKLNETGWYISGQIPKKLCISIDKLMQHRPKELGTVVMMGKTINTPRFVEHYLKPYYYTGKIHASKDLPVLFQPLLDWANKNMEEGKFSPNKEKCPSFNQVLVNYYMDGSHYIGRHSDDEKQLVPNSPILSLSFGETRTFRIRNKSDKEIVNNIDMKDGTFILMGGKMQKEFTHEVPKILGMKGTTLKPRVNITFRVFK